MKKTNVILLILILFLSSCTQKLPMLEGKVVQVSNGLNHSLVLLDDNSVWGWGQLSLELGNKENYVDEPILVAENVVFVSGGNTSTFIVKEDGTLWEINDIRIARNKTFEEEATKLMDNVKKCSYFMGNIFIITKENKLYGIDNNA